MIEILKIFGPIIGSGIVVYFGASGYLQRKQDKPKTDAEVRKMDLDLQVTVIERLEGIIRDNDVRIDKVEKKNLEIEDKYETRIKAMEARYEERIRLLISDFESKLAEKDRIHAAAILEKDKRIDELEIRIDELSLRLKHYEQMDIKVSDVKDTIQGAADTLGNIKN